MARYLNLIQDRGPKKPGLDRRLEGWGRLAGMAFLLVSSGLRMWGSSRRRPQREARFRVGVAFAAGAGAGIAVWAVIRALASAPLARAAADRAIDRDSADSFPASDAPQRWR